MNDKLLEMAYQSGAIIQLQELPSIKREVFFTVEQFEKFTQLIKADCEKDGWIKCSDELPKINPDSDRSNNVIGLCEGKRGIFCRTFDVDNWFWARANMFGYTDLADVECEFDDDYDVTHWMPLFNQPSEDKP